MQLLETRVNRNLLLAFFLSFARFEYALKSTGFFVRKPEDPLRPPGAEPDWDRFAVSLRDSFDCHKNNELTEACRYFLESPPNKQVIVNDAPAWETPVRGTQAEIEFILRMVRAVRNNLFHGGKHSIDVHESIERTELLLTHSLVVLNECLEVAPVQQAAYLEAVL